MAYPRLKATAWTRPDSYFGHNPEGDFVLYAKNRDSDVLTESNFDRIYEDMCKAESRLPPDDDRESLVTKWSANHWACGWIEYLMLSKDAPDSLKELAESVLKALENYPVYDENDFSEREWNHAQEVWKECFSLREKIKMCAEEGISIFAARRAYIPEGDNGAIYERCRE